MTRRGGSAPGLTRAKHAVGRRAQTAERLFLQPIADGPRQEILRECGWRIGRKRLSPTRPQLLNVHLADTRERGVGRLSRHEGRLSSGRPAESHYQAAAAAGVDAIR